MGFLPNHERAPERDLPRKRGFPHYGPASAPLPQPPGPDKRRKNRPGLRCGSVETCCKVPERSEAEWRRPFRQSQMLCLL